MQKVKENVLSEAIRHNFREIIAVFGSLHAPTARAHNLFSHRTSKFMIEQIFTEFYSEAKKMPFSEHRRKFHPPSTVKLLVKALKS